MTKLYSHAAYDQLVERTISAIRELSTIKGGEYSGDDDRLANFRRNAEKCGVEMTTIWSVYLNKHLDAIQQWVKDCQTGKTRPRSESISGRMDDAIVYLILGKAIVEEMSAESVKMSGGIVTSKIGPAEHYAKVIPGETVREACIRFDEYVNGPHGSSDPLEPSRWAKLNFPGNSSNFHDSYLAWREGRHVDDV